MVKQLFLIRHAEAEEQQRGETDFGRNLTRTGMRSAALVGNHLNSKNTIPDVFMSSDAQRTTQTSEIIADQIKYDTQKILFSNDIYEASLRILMRTINAVDESCNTLILVGHNPGISFIAEYLSGNLIGNVVPGGVVEIHFGGLSWGEVTQASGTLKEYFTPDQSIGE